MPDERPFEETHPHLLEFTAFLGALNKESERGVVLVAAAMIDNLLERTILAFLVDHKETGRLLEGFNAPLGTFSSRILGALALGLLSEAEYRECENLRRVRNVFAHNVHASFQDQKVQDICRNLEYSAKDYGDVHVEARGQYTTAAVALILFLTNRPVYASRQRLKHQDWQH
jgi:hypothetical protein